MIKYIIIIAYVIFLYSCSIESDKTPVIKTEQLKENKNPQEKKEFNFSRDKLKTNTKKTSIDIKLVLDWWPWKDWIPAINKPNFLSISEAKSYMKYLTDDETWIAVSLDWISRFYPFSILVWHEIVNDVIWENKFAVTFCPLCWSSIVFDRVVNWEELYFGVSWKLYELNMLMYDNKTETLWSQSLWKAVVWDMLWIQLENIRWNVLSFSDFISNFPDWKVLSDKTGFSRNYWVIPYGNYDKSDLLYFPIQNTDASFHKKEMFYIVNHSWFSIAFNLKDLVKEETASLQIWDKVYNAIYNKWLIEVNFEWESIPWYYEMWFSFITHNMWNKNIWSK